MKRISLLLPALIVAGMLSAQSRIEEFTVKSDLLGVEKTCSVYLPDGYDATKSYPVLYLLHGAGGNHKSWLTAGNARTIADETIAEGKAAPMLIVMPDASGEGPKLSGRHMGYFNVPGWPYEDFFFRELLPAVEKRYPIRGDKANRAIAGLSMGGGATAVYTLRHPELFGSACSLSGLLDTIPGKRSYDEVFMHSVAENSPLRILRELSDDQAAQQRTVRWWVDCGDDDFLWESNIGVYQTMRQRNIPLQYRMRDGGHTWRYWQTTLPDVLSFISTRFEN